jgi:hypothetical protein
VYIHTNRTAGAWSRARQPDITAFPRFLTLSTLLQVDTANTQAATANIRLRWNYRPDSDVYVIYTAGQRFASLVATNPPQFYENRFAIKFTYSWRP